MTPTAARFKKATAAVRGLDKTFATPLLCHADVAFATGLRLSLVVDRAISDQIARWAQGSVVTHPFILLDAADGYTYVMSLRHLVVAQVSSALIPSPEAREELRRGAAVADRIRLFTIGQTPIEVPIDSAGPVEEDEDGDLQSFVEVLETLCEGDESILSLTDSNGGWVVIRPEALVAAIFPTHLRGSDPEDAEDPEDSPDR